MAVQDKTQQSGDGRTDGQKVKTLVQAGPSWVWQKLDEDLVYHNTNPQRQNNEIKNFQQI